MLLVHRFNECLQLLADDRLLLLQSTHIFLHLVHSLRQLLSRVTLNLRGLSSKLPDLSHELLLHILHLLDLSVPLARADLVLVAGQEMIIVVENVNVLLPTLSFPEELDQLANVDQHL